MSIGIAKGEQRKKAVSKWDGKQKDNLN